MKTLPLIAVLATLSSASGAELVPTAPRPLQTSGAQKMCMIFASTYNTVLLFSYPAPASWNIYTCALNAQRIANEIGLPWNQVSYRVECLFDTADPASSLSRGAISSSSSMASAPPVNCGW